MDINEILIFIKLEDIDCDLLRKSYVCSWGKGTKFCLWLGENYQINAE